MVCEFPGWDQVEACVHSAAACGGVCSGNGGGVCAGDGASDTAPIEARFFVVLGEYEHVIFLVELHGMGIICGDGACVLYPVHMHTPCGIPKTHPCHYQNPLCFEPYNTHLLTRTHLNNSLPPPLNTHTGS